MVEDVLVVAGRSVPDGWGRVARYCGVARAGEPPEVWAFPYYDQIALTAESDRPDAIDVLAAGAMHPGLTRGELEGFVRGADELAQWLATVPGDVDLADATDADLETVTALSSLGLGIGLPLLSKVVHRHRPRLVPLVDRAVLDAYRRQTDERTADRAWPRLLACLRTDLGGTNRPILESYSDRVAIATGTRISPVRVLDIVVWMGGQP